MEFERGADDVLEAAARRAEEVLSAVRAGFCAVVAMRFLALWATQEDGTNAARALWMLPPTLGACAASIAVVWHLRRGGGAGDFLRWSVVFDAGIAALVLASNVLVPFPAYRGILLLPETAVFLVLIMAAGFRVSQGSAVLGAAANLGALAVLVALDLSLVPERVDYDAGHAVLWALLMLGASVLAISGSRRTRRLVREVARRATDVESARERFTAILDEHHDAASTLGAALLTTDQLGRMGADPTLLQHLRADLAAVDLSVRAARDHAWRDKLALHPIETVTVGAVVNSAWPSLERLAAPARLVRGTIDDARISLPCGQESLRRVLLNLVVNARQGDGTTGATRIRVSVVAQRGEVQLTIDDDGPGFPEDGLPAHPAGTGRGLEIVGAIAASAGGRLVFESGEGARVTMTVPEG